jgi:hypothetical protein
MWCGQESPSFQATREEKKAFWGIEGDTPWLGIFKIVKDQSYHMKQNQDRNN